MLSIYLGLCLLADPPAEPAPQRAERLVRDLENPSYRKREAAARDLLAMGVAAKPALTAGLKSGDAEVRDRCRRLLPEVLALELKNRLDAFEKDADGKLSHDLPGWDRFRKIAGTDKNAREFYLQMMRRLPSAVLQMDSDAAKLAVAVRYRQAEILAERDAAAERCGGRRATAEKEKPSFDAAEIAFLMFAATDAGVSAELRRWPNEDRTIRLCSDPIFEQALRHAKTGPTCQKLVIGWMRSRTDDPADIEELDGAFEFAKNNDIPGTLELALAWIDRDRPADELLAALMTVVGKCGNARHIPKLARYTAIADEFSTINNRQKAFHIQYRDIAVAMTMHLQGLKPSDFGFEMLGRGQREIIFSPYYFGFSSEELRQKAYDRYAHWLRK